VRRAPTRRGFTVVELLVSMALIVFIMVILSQAFAAGMETLRQLKALGDQEERLRAAATVLRRDLDAANFDAAWFVADGLRTGTPDPDAAADLRRRYEAIRVQAGELDTELAVIERRTVDPATRLAIRRVRVTLLLIKEAAASISEILCLLTECD
jgi:prepilin-type N-terminal cleavage/methylation domain-containing protein